MRWGSVFTPEFGPLLHTKAVLFINYHHTQIFKHHFVLNQGMCTYQYVNFAGFKRCMQLCPLFLCGTSRKDGYFNQPVF
ncbi:hypothetical protein D3C87_1865670 [compost metagenome]